uniref:Nuclear cap-binding protein subunit 1 n=2 Tax=Ciona savignyi TaxID=51511 RepID=H2YUE9_CIOSA
RLSLRFRSKLRRALQRDPGSSDDEGKGSFNKRRKVTESSEEIERRLESLICRVGEKSSSSLESNLEGLATVLEADLPNFKSQILQILVLCSYQLPEKCSIYTTLVGLLNVRNYNCGGEFVEMMLRELKRLISTNQFDYARYMVQFLSDLVNCNLVTPTSLISLYNIFISVTRQDSLQSRKDWYVYAVLSSLPWAGSALSEKHSVEVATLFDNIRKYIVRRDKSHQEFLRVWSTDDPHPQEEYLDCLFAQVCKLREDGWIEDVIIRPYRAFPVLANALQHDLPDFVVPPYIAEASLYPIPQVIFRMFDYTDCPEGPLIPGNHAIERWLIEEQLRNTVRHFKELIKKRRCADQTSSGFSWPREKRFPLNHNDFPVYPMVMYTAVFIELCKLQPSMIPQVLAIASDMLYERLDTMNITCTDRFVNWFSQHLSNFQFRWSWDDWSDCLSCDPASPKPKFIKEVLEKSMRLSYHKRICDAVPQDFAALVPVEPKIEFKYDFKLGPDHSQEERAAYNASQRVITAIKTKCKEDELIIMLEDIHQEESNIDGSTFSLPRLEVFLQSLLFLAQKSFSHSFSAIFKFHKVLKWAGDGEEGKVAILGITKDVWKNHPQMMGVLVDKMIRMQVVDCASVAKWIFSPNMADDFTRLYVWEIMHSTIRKMNKHVIKIEAELGEMRSKAQVSEKKSEDEEDDLMNTYNIFAPNQDDLQRMQDQLETANGEQKKLFLIIFQRFIMILSDHLVRCDAGHTNFNTPWYRNAIQRLQEIFLLHKDTVKKYMSTMENLLFTMDLDTRILSVFKQFLSVAN